MECADKGADALLLRALQYMQDQGKIEKQLINIIVHATKITPYDDGRSDNTLQVKVFPFNNEHIEYLTKKRSRGI